MFVLSGCVTVAFFASLSGSDTDGRGARITRGAGGAVLITPPSSAGNSVASADEPIVPPSARAVVDSWLVATFDEKQRDNMLSFSCCWRPESMRLEVWRCVPPTPVASSAHAADEIAPLVLRSCEFTDIVDGTNVCDVT